MRIKIVDVIDSSDIFLYRSAKTVYLGNKNLKEFYNFIIIIIKLYLQYL